MPARFGRRLRCLPALLFAIGATMGCGEQPVIRSYDVPRDAKVVASATADATPQRMIAAIVPRDSQAWFVKVLGPKEQVDRVADDVRKFVDSFTLPVDQPNAVNWKAPAAWKDAGERMMREATYLLPVGDPPLEVAISKLGYPGPSEQYLLDNLNRWRGQLGIASATSLADMDDVAPLEIEDGKVWLFDAVGESTGGGMQPPMMAAGAAPETARRSPDANSAPPVVSNAKPTLKFEAPSDWQEQQRGSMGSRNYTIATSDGELSVKLSDFPPVRMMVDPLENINRWRGQMGQPPLEQDALENETNSIEIAGADGIYTTIAQPDESEAMLAAMVVAKDQVWFFQLKGPPAAVSEKQEEFLAWLRTVEIDMPEAGKEHE